MDQEERLRAALAGRYRIEREIGKGGMATVYLAWDLKHDRNVAVKVLDPELAQTLGAERFLREIKTVARLSHPHILPLHDSGEADGSLYYVMPFVEGESLSGKLTLEKQLSIEEALEITREVADALDSAHKRGIVHRDIKPANILLGEGHALVADFGIALAVESAGGDRITQSGLSVGSPAYMSPEQIAGEEEIDARADIYSLACVLYEMLAGEPPFTGPNTRVVVAKHLATPAPSILQVRPAIPQPVADAISKALCKDPPDRQGSAGAFYEGLRAEVPEANQKSIAVLPFTNMSADPENEYFGDGITEEIINALTKPGEFRVAARTSSFAFKGKNPDIKEVGRQLKVATVLEGSVRKAGNRLRITAQLINVADGYHLWSERYDRELNDVFAIQDEISRSIVKALRPKVLGQESGPLVIAPTRNLDAFDQYLRGRHFLDKRYERSLVTALRYFEKAVEIDPKFALPYAGISESFSILGLYGFLHPNVARQKALSAAQCAMDLDPELSEAHAAMGYFEIFLGWDWEKAISEFSIAIDLKPENAKAHAQLGLQFGLQGRFEESFTELAVARDLDPFSDYIATLFAINQVYAGDYDTAFQTFRKLVDSDPSDLFPTWLLSWASHALGQWDDAVRFGQRAASLTNNSAHYIGWLGCSLGKAGDLDGAREILKDLSERSESEFVSPMCMSEVYYGLGEEERALDSMEVAATHRCPFLFSIHQDVVFPTLWGNPRFNKLVKKVGAGVVARRWGSLDSVHGET